jgi:hypothetical protein
MLTVEDLQETVSKGDLESSVAILEQIERLLKQRDENIRLDRYG